MNVSNCNGTDYNVIVKLLGAASYDPASAASIAEGICANYTVDDLTPMGAVLSWTMAETSANVAAIKETAYGLDTLFCLISAYLVFTMQMGFALFAAGIVRARNISSILMKNVSGLATSAVAYYLIGFAFEFGSKGQTNGFIGYGNFALSQIGNCVPVARIKGTCEQSWQIFMFQWGFCAASTSILSGSVAERATLVSYMIYAWFFSAWVYPVVGHWHWSPTGWISAYNANPVLGIGVVDFAGSGVVHTLGGFSALCAAVILGPRMGRFDHLTDQRAFTVAPNPSLYLLGSLLLWFGWYGFNPGSLMQISSNMSATIVGRTAVNTTLSSAAGALACLLLVHLRTKTWSLLATSTGSLAGLVAITSGCSVVEPWAAVICGILAAPCCVYSELMLEYFGIDDPVNAFALHGMCGLWGMIFVGFFAEEHFLFQVYGAPAGHHLMGLFNGGHGQLLLCEVIAMVAIIGWVVFWIGGLFWIMRYMGILRVNVAHEAEGLDLAQMGVKSEHGKARTQTTSFASTGSPRRAPSPAAYKAAMSFNPTASAGSLDPVVHDANAMGMRSSSSGRALLGANSSGLDHDLDCINEETSNHGIEMDGGMRSGPTAVKVVPGGLYGNVELPEEGRRTHNSVSVVVDSSQVVG